MVDLLEMEYIKITSLKDKKGFPIKGLNILIRLKKRFQKITEDYKII